MGTFDIIAVLIVLAAVFSVVNYHVLKLPATIGLMLLSLVHALGLMGLGQIEPGLLDHTRAVLNGIDFNETLMHGMLGFLLFAGALHVDLNELRQQRMIISILATVGVIVSTLVVGTAMWLIVNRGFGVTQLTWVYGLLFGALISPTDPIAVLSILKKLGVSKSIETKITGESLFNDGVGVVVFLAIVGLAGLGGGDGHGHVTAGSIGRLFVVEVGGGAAVGLVAGLLTYWLLRRVDNYQVEVLLSLALVTGGYALCSRLHMSGPIAMVVAGLLIGNGGRHFAMSETTRLHLDMFWELIDEILNAILFVLIGLEVVVVEFTGRFLLMGLIAIPVVLAARFAAVGLPVAVLRQVRSFSPHAAKMLTWGGLRGGISVALALSLEDTLGARSAEVFQLIMVMTYVVVVFSILVQGLTMGPVVRRLGLDLDA